MSVVAHAAAIAAGAGALTWLYLLAFRQRFWRADQRLRPPSGTPPAIEIVAVIPARNEADVIGACIASLLKQSLAPPIRIILVDDESDDATQRAAVDAARECGAADRLTVIQGTRRPDGWTGKMWAVAQGAGAAEQIASRYLLLSDADIRHGPEVVAQMVMLAEAEKLDLVSLLVRLHCQGVIERLLIPAFVFFFQKLYPFRAINDPKSATAAAAGGCMLVRADALKRAGGIAAVRDELIDDCALARLLKSFGPIWLGLTTQSVSLRPYRGLADIWRMVARSAYTQLGHSPWRLIGAVAGMTLAYVTAPVALLIGLVLGKDLSAALGAAAWLLMGVAYAPTLRLYDLSPLWACALPASALLYTIMTVDSAWQHARGRGGEWKGRLGGGLVSDPAAGPGAGLRRLRSEAS